MVLSLNLADLSKVQMKEITELLLAQVQLHAIQHEHTPLAPPKGLLSNEELLFQKSMLQYLIQGEGQVLLVLRTLEDGKEFGKRILLLSFLFPLKRWGYFPISYIV